MNKPLQFNVLGEPLQTCGLNPVTGWLRDGNCLDCDQDGGRHLICVKVSRRFLEYSATVGNDLASARLEQGFPGLKPGDFWCVCASRWLQAHEAGCAPQVRLAATNAAASQIVPIELLREAACDLD